ncbi:tRNA (5-methylaminomethyl-2-thiouridine)(34)-methyltransferase MnmD [Flavihumibacter stibioxidans]|uniref:MnmC-like methyltransferase domain-containing protein n=1 Tax=Flavihumibacter stibioxidans TaxID=1834163 RepID=A0ABR7M9R5_9BACT|nr:tRNA (5-methylaminomethyl-2-thiouridine)(34)-methyltransferase MnmD [Flavihumibacter stibioxidans]MBC6491787.1 hypothetical protein [Flavihumibacter stibioxidans]
MERILQATSDGSHTIAIPSMEVTYHSKHGAIQESMHVFIEAGWKQKVTRPDESINILEIGFGTGLNALLTLMEATTQTVWYESLEAYPIDLQTAGQLNYCQLLHRPDLQHTFLEMHTGEWNKPLAIAPNFTLCKRHTKLQDYQQHDKKFDLVYFDAFAPKVQPELWSTEIFQKIFNLLKPGATLVTYCSKGEVRRALKAAGFMVEKIPGPPGKREMVRARKAATTNAGQSSA